MECHQRVLRRQVIVVLRDGATGATPAPVPRPIERIFLRQVGKYQFPMFPRKLQLTIVQLSNLV